MGEFKSPSIDKIIAALEPTLKKMKECEKRGHPYESHPLSGYQGRNPIMVRCSHCDAFYERRATAAEMEGYHNLLTLEITI